MLKAALNALTRIHSRSAMIKRLGSVDMFTPCRITPSNFFRFLSGPEYTTIKGTEFIIPVDSLLGEYSQDLIFSGIPDDGTFKLKFGTSSTVSLDFDTTAEAIQTEVRKIDGLNNVVVSGGFPTFTFLFKGTYLEPGLGEVTDSTLEADSDQVTSSWKKGFVTWQVPIKKGDRIIDGSKVLSIDEIIEMCDLGTQVMAYRVRCD